MSAGAPDRNAMLARFLGCAFAAGDLIFETDEAGVVQRFVAVPVVAFFGVPPAHIRAGM